MIHDRLPFLDLPDRAVRRRGRDAVLVHRAARGQQVGCVVARVVEGFDLRLERLAVLLLRDQRKLAFGVFRDGHEDHGQIQRGREAEEARVFAGDVNRLVAPVGVSDLDGGHDVELRA